jgi:hypothetical protein
VSANERASGMPASTFTLAAPSTSLSSVDSACSVRVWRAGESPTPAVIIIDKCLAILERCTKPSLPLDEPKGVKAFTCSPFSSRVSPVIKSPCAFSMSKAKDSSGASIWPLINRPLASRARYEKVAFILHLLRKPILRSLEKAL